MTETNNHRWIQTFTGKRFYPTDPKAEDIDVRDIAHALSMLCRFGGQIKSFYSVGDHSIRVCDILPPELKLVGLLHDATEGLGMVDLPRPLKIQIPRYKAIEEELWRCIAEKFELPSIIPDEVKVADNILLNTERRDLFNVHIAWPDWTDGENGFIPQTIVPRTPQEAEMEFLKRFQALYHI